MYIRANTLLLSLFILLVSITSCNKITEISEDSINVTEIKTDTLFDSNQEIYILSLFDKSFDDHTIEIGYSEITLEKTSVRAETNNAAAAINGSFFDMTYGGSITYLEVNDSVISTTNHYKLEENHIDSIVNGALILTKNNELRIESAHTDLYYEESNEEAFVITSGPLLLINSTLPEIPNSGIAHRNPRTCLCISIESIMLICIDGRTEEAEGMTFIEIQQYLFDLGCIDAINLDGGGSTTMWTKNKGVINNPSGDDGERSVANSILILENE